MRILSITKSTGGVAVYNRDLCEGLTAAGYDVRCVSLSEGHESYSESLEARGVPSIGMPMKRYAIAPLSDTRLAFRLLSEVRRNPVDLIVAHGAKAGLLARLVGRLTRTRALYVLHSQPYLERVQGRQAVIYRQLERVGALLGGELVAITESMRESLRKNRIAPASKISVVRTGIDPTPFAGTGDSSAARVALGLDPRRPVVGWAGRLTPQKAPLDYVTAADRLSRLAPDAQIFLAGEGPLEEAVRAHVERLGFGESFVQVGWQQDVPTMLSAFDIYVLTSYWEGLPLSLLEAMAAGRAVVAAAVDGVPEVVEDGVQGFLVEPGDCVALADRVKELLENPSLRRRMGEAARTRVVEDFSVEKMMANWRALIEARREPG